MRRLLSTTALAVACLSLSSIASASTIIDFESPLAGLDVLTNQLSGLSFSNTSVLASGSIGGTLNEFEFPPRSGTNVVSDTGGSLTITFDSPLLTVGGYFTHLTGLTFQAFDLFNTSLGSVSSSFANNLLTSGDSGSSPNEFLQFTSALGIKSVTITGDPGGGSFTLDDLTLTDLPLQSTPIPEPSTIVLVLGGLAPLLRHYRARRSR